MIKFGTIKEVLGFYNTDYLDSRDRYPLETTKCITELPNYNLLISEFIERFTVHQYDPTARVKQFIGDNKDK